MVPTWAVALIDQLGIYFGIFLFGTVFVQITKNAGRPSAIEVRESYLKWGLNKVVFGSDIVADDSKSGSDVARRWGVLWVFLFCAMGLLGSYLVWGVFQEILSSEVKSSTFLVFCNRIVATLVSGFVVAVPRNAECPRQYDSCCPFHLYALVSFSNVLSSWCQLESLKYVSFPTQVLAKSSKLIPVMLMGILLLNKKIQGV
mmetsp:Transcript_23934/g.52126  ORF Transcript_23934/g.52126 Transcript_23934/m.52126 type:complete len:201 (-) Transcript_23934:1008-1610(-)